MSGKREKEKRKLGRLNFTNCNPYQAMGWMYGFCCKSLDEGVDIRTLDVPALMKLAEDCILAETEK